MLSWFNSFQLLNSVDYYFLKLKSWNFYASYSDLRNRNSTLVFLSFFLFKLLIFQLPIINLLHKIGINEEKKKKEQVEPKQEPTTQRTTAPPKKKKNKRPDQKGGEGF